MNKIDWSKAPSWADELSTDGKDKFWISEYGVNAFKVCLVNDGDPFFLSDRSPMIAGLEQIASRPKDIGKNVGAGMKSTIEPNKYDRQLKGRTVDVYDVLKAFDVTCPALQHLIKKALCVGIRGHKDTAQDLQDIVDSAQRAMELYGE